VHGFPKVMGVLTHLDEFTDATKLKKVKKTLKARLGAPVGIHAHKRVRPLAPDLASSRAQHRFWTEIYNGAKLFYISGMVRRGGRQSRAATLAESQRRTDPRTLQQARHAQPGALHLHRKGALPPACRVPPSSLHACWCTVADGGTRARRSSAR
jgi:hypothetical protein